MTRHGYRLSEIAAMPLPELDARLELIAGKPRNGSRTYKSQRIGKVRS